MGSVSDERSDRESSLAADVVLKVGTVAEGAEDKERGSLLAGVEGTSRSESVDNFSSSDRSTRKENSTTGINIRKNRSKKLSGQRTTQVEGMARVARAGLGRRVTAVICLTGLRVAKRHKRTIELTRTMMMQPVQGLDFALADFYRRRGS